MKVKIRFLKPWYLHPVEYCGEWSNSITYAGEYDMNLVEDDPFDGPDGEKICKMEALREVVEYETIAD